ncbi:hypothetical protein D9M70_642330 [compost metagenome]
MAHSSTKSPWLVWLAKYSVCSALGVVPDQRARTPVSRPAAPMMSWPATTASPRRTMAPGRALSLLLMPLLLSFLLVPLSLLFKRVPVS